MSDTPVSKLQVLPSFERLVNENGRLKPQRQRDCLAMSPRRLGSYLSRREHRKRLPHRLHRLKKKFAVLSLRYSGSKLPGSETSSLGTVGDMMAVVTQADYCHRERRANSLRHASFVRRVTHTANRRTSHGQDGGYLVRRVLTPIVDSMQEGQS